MRTTSENFKNAIPILILAFLFISGYSYGEGIIPQDETSKKEKKDKKRKDEFKVYAGVNFNSLLVDENTYTSALTPGWMIGGSYKRGKFFYWEVGVRYNNPVYDLRDATIPTDSSNLLDGVFSTRNIDVPLTVGINFLSFASRIVGLRLFIGATPQFTLGVSGNDLGIDADNVNTFNVLGQGGIGVDVAFIYIESGINYGFMDLVDNDVQSNPMQLFVNLGFRF